VWISIGVSVNGRFGSPLRVRPAIRQGEEDVAAGIREAGADAAKPVAGDAVFERPGGLRREILVGAADGANGNEHRIRRVAGGNHQRRGEQRERARLKATAAA
jgi:hypothetical protein